MVPHRVAGSSAAPPAAGALADGPPTRPVPNLFGALSGSGRGREPNAPTPGTPVPAWTT